MVAWNIACLGKYILAITSKQDNVWIRWIHSVYILGVIISGLTLLTEWLAGIGGKFAKSNIN